MENLQNLPAVGEDDALHEYLQKGITQIHGSPDAQLPMNIYMNLYSAAWRLTYSHKPEDNKRNGHAFTYPSVIIYENLSNFLTNHLHLIAERILSQDSNVLFQTYLDEWERYNAAAKRVDHLLNLINRHWIRRVIDEGKREVFLIYTLHCVQWRDNLWSRVSDSVVSSAQQVIQKGDSNAAHAQDLLERFASLRIGEPVAETDETIKIQESLEAPFISKIQAHHKTIDDAIEERQRVGVQVQG
ncbi:ubiquitin ligase (cullin) of SCF [Fusarium chlamydosporum]